MLGNRPWRCRRWIHWQSSLSVLGRPWIWRVNLAEVVMTCNPASSRVRNRTWPYAPVASSATVVTPHSLQPGDELPQSGCVGGKLADGVGSVRAWTRRRPSGCGRRHRCRRRGNGRRAWHRSWRRPVPLVAVVLRVEPHVVWRVGSPKEADSSGEPWVWIRSGRKEVFAGGSRHRSQPSQRDQPIQVERIGRHQTSGPKTLPGPVAPSGGVDCNRLATPKTLRAWTGKHSE